MNKKYCIACAGAFSLMALGCSGGDISGSSEDPNVLMAQGPSSSVLDNSSSSVDGLSSGSFDASAGNLWNPSAGDFSIAVARYAAALPAHAKADGRWFVQTDAEKGGSSSVVWPADLVGAQGERTVVETCNGICGTVSLARYSEEYDPFAGVAFTLAVDDEDKPVPVDVSDWGGVCVTYESEAAPTLELDLGDSVNALLGGALPAAAMPKTKTSGPVTKCLKWSNFMLPAWIAAVDGVPEYWFENSGERAAKQLVAFKFVIYGATGEFKFNIKSLGTYSDQASNPASSSSALTGVSSSSSVMAMSDLWGPYDEKVNVALYADGSWKDLAHGGWFAYVDDADFGWDDFMAPDDYHYGYLIATMERSLGFLQTDVSFSEDDLGHEPLAMFGFKLAQDGSDTIPLNERSWQIIPNYIPVDISNWGALCVTYNSDFPISVEIGLGSAYNDSLGYDYLMGPGIMPSSTLPATATDMTVCTEWSEFEQPGLKNIADGDKFKMPGAEAAKRAVEIVFRVKGKVGQKGAFAIKALGTNRN